MITKYEYLKLKEQYKNGYHWIARNKDEELCVYKSEPIKLKFSWRAFAIDEVTAFGYDFLLPYIKWEDEKPTRIDDLIRDYESHRVIVGEKVKVEKDKKYILKFSNGQYLYSCDLGMADESLACKLTKAEIEAVDPRLMQFAVEVE